MRLVFMGTPEFAVPSLEALGREHEVVAVFTQPDRPAGRKQQLKMSPVKVKALEMNVPVYQPERIKSPEVIAQLQALNPEAIVVVAYGQILPKEILVLPRYGCINVHASLLPAYRGAAPIHWAIINGEKLTGVTTMLMDEGLDTGDILLRKELPIAQDATTGEVHDLLAQMGGKLIVKTLAALEAGTLKPVPQRGPSSYAPMLTREHERLDWQQTAVQIHNRIRGLNPWPGAFSLFQGETVKIWRSALPEASEMPAIPENEPSAAPGTIVGVTARGIIVQTGAGRIELLEVQPAGKRIMGAKDFFNGRRGRVGDRFESS